MRSVRRKAMASEETMLDMEQDWDRYDDVKFSDEDDIFDLDFLINEGN